MCSGQSRSVSQMTTSPETLADQILDSAVRLWVARQPGADPDWIEDAKDLGAAVAEVTDNEVSNDTGIDLNLVRACLVSYEGRGLVTNRHGETVAVKVVERWFADEIAEREASPLADRDRT